MKSFALPLAAALLASLLTAGALELRRPAPAATAERALPSVEPATRAAAPGSATPAGALALPVDLERELAHLERVDELEERVLDLEARLSELTVARRAVPESLASAALTPGEAARLAETGEDAREFVLDVLTAEREEREAEQAERRQALLEQRLARQAERIATELGLVPRDRDAVYSVMLEENQRRGAVMDRMRTGDLDAIDRESVRSEMEAIRGWKSEELTTRLGPELAEQVLALDRERGWRPDARGGGGGGPRRRAGD
jgi:hypothetical protein